MQYGVGLMRRTKDPVVRIPDILKSRLEHESVPSLRDDSLILKQCFSNTHYWALALSSELSEESGSLRHERESVSR